ncbi:MAG: hypothetical protein RLZ10_2286, partial [Bacteroidota bacterium]
MDPGILVPPIGYGGHERLVHLMAKAYLSLGHDVHLLVTKGSFVEGCIIHDFGKEGFPPKKINALLAIPIAWRFLWKNRNSFDLVHNFGRLAYLMPILNHSVKKIMTYGREISIRNINILNNLPQKKLALTGCSKDLVSRVGIRINWNIVYNCIAFDSYTLQTTISSDAPLIFLGRLERVKGVHIAIQVAKLTRNKLIIAGNISTL